MKTGQISQLSCNINNGTNFDFGIAMERPFSKNIAKRASEETGHAAEKREQRKILKYTKDS